MLTGRSLHLNSQDNLSWALSLTSPVTRMGDSSSFYNMYLKQVKRRQNISTSASAIRSRFEDSDSSPFDSTLFVVFSCSIMSFMNSAIWNTVPSWHVSVRSLTLLDDVDAVGTLGGELRCLIPCTLWEANLVGLRDVSSLVLFLGLWQVVLAGMPLTSSRVSSIGMQSSSTSEHPSSSEFTLSKR